jgi:hypothetical protein
VNSILSPRERFELRQFREAGVNVEECAIYFKVPPATVVRVLAELREKLGPEKRRPSARSRELYPKVIPELAKWLRAPRLTRD